MIVSRISKSDQIWRVNSSIELLLIVEEISLELDSIGLHLFDDFMFYETNALNQYLAVAEYKSVVDRIDNFKVRSTNYMNKSEIDLIRPSLIKEGEEIRTRISFKTVREAEKAITYFKRLCCNPVYITPEGFNLAKKFMDDKTLSVFYKGVSF